MTTVLVTGVGAIIGYGVLNSLRAADPSIRLIGADIYSDAVGQEWADSFVVAPYTSADHYSQWLEQVIKEYSIDLLIPCIEQDLHYCSDHRADLMALGVKVVLNNAELIDLTKDKWHFHQEMKKISSSARIESYLEGSFSALSDLLGLPFMLKPRKGYASKGLIIVRSEADFIANEARLGDVLMAQPLVGHDDDEYTVGVFGDGAGNVCSSIALRRRLAIDGSTAKAWVVQDSSLDEVVSDLCSHFAPVGPTNLQFRKVIDGWKLLEINPRISSSTSLRTAFGYNESMMCVDFFLKDQQISQPVLRSGSASRYIADRVVYDSDNL
ncbi:MAG: ATP-grasp domain-containing protein [Acidiferrobacterales bacterium]|nr:ATP-grasp domain-containing protein [Acidiferrobacterales bacterium]